ncbi:MAG: biopolymer transporter ExbD [Pseudomonadota bacterium]|nr:biopolymer transporter ExbD [Pseudomonadota bacterium]MDP1906016.1 biopolymer transporter ExbD [Pseudomonadota bacterium]MDP2352487.1 biopolymer transporter ExbD [Pseudomonadota bacterium]
MAIRQESDFQPMSEINVTPLVDVMLVLLVIFMVTAPFILQSVKVRLPETSPVAVLKPTPALVVSVQADGLVFLGRDAIDVTLLEARLKGEMDKNGELTLQLRADTGVPYGRITEVMAAASRAGVAKLTFITAAAPREKK